jgi:cysteinyl-tRNA synthetase
MVDVLGIDPLNPRWRRRASDSGATTALGALVDTFLTMRSQARADKDWAAADDIRGRLSAAGITIEDTPSGAKWSIHG